MSAEFQEDADRQRSQMLQQQVDRFYRHYAGLTSKGEAAFFAEKFLFDPAFLDQSREIYPELVPILLVRDPRDMICSILAFNARRGTADFLQEEGDTDTKLVAKYAPILDRVAEWWQQHSRSCILLHYEDLVVSPVPTLARLFSRLDLEISSRDIVSIIRAVEACGSNDRHMTADSVNKSIGRWRSEMSLSAAELSRSKYHAFLEIFEYE